MKQALFTFKNALAFEQEHSNADNPTHVPAYVERCNIISYACHLKGQCTVVPCCTVPLKAVSLRREMAYANSDISADLAAATPPSGFEIACIPCNVDILLQVICAEHQNQKASQIT